MEAITHGISIKGICAVVPDKTVENTCFIGKFSEKKVKMQLKMTGIKRRHIANENQEAKDLCTYAANKLLDKMSIDRKEICAIIFVSQTPSFIIPSTAFWIHNQLKLSKQCVAYDINLGCSGFVDGLHTIASIMQSQEIGKKGLLLNADTISKYIDSDNEATSMIFGDAGTATLLERTEQNDLKCWHNINSEKYQNILVKTPNHKLVMDGMQVFSYTLEQVAGQIKNLLKEQNNYDYYLLHQAQKYIVDNISSLCGLPQEKVLTSFEEYGNTSGASIPLTICHNKEYFTSSKNYSLLVSGFGAGLSCTSASVIMKTPEIMDVMML